MDPTANERYRVRTDARRHALGSNEEALDAPGLHAILLPADVAGWAVSLRGFATLETHAARGSLELGRPRAEVQAELARLVAAGVLVGERDLVERCMAWPRSAAPPHAITTVGIPTRNRPELLER